MSPDQSASFSEPMKTNKESTHSGGTFSTRPISAEPSVASQSGMSASSNETDEFTRQLISQAVANQDLALLDFPLSYAPVDEDCDQRGSSIWRFFNERRRSVHKGISGVFHSLIGNDHSENRVSGAGSSGDSKKEKPGKRSFLDKLHITKPSLKILESKVPQKEIRRRRKVQTLLWGSSTDDEHYEKISLLLRTASCLKGEEGLRAIGFNFRLLPCEKHQAVPESSCHDDVDPCAMVCEESNDNGEETKMDKLCLSEEEDKLSSSSEEVMIIEIDDSINVEGKDDLSATEEVPISSTQHKTTHYNKHNCHNCCTRLYHIESNTLISNENRKAFIADDDMYEELARLTQETAQALMQEEGHLEWVTICNDQTKGEPIRALVTKQNSSSSSSQSRGKTLLIATGKGKVRAGIFSRQHLLITSMESSTALPVIWEANKRGMKVAILDPNARGDREGMPTFTQSMTALFNGGEFHHYFCSAKKDEEGHHDDDVFVLAHSQAGAQLVRFMRDQDREVLSRVRAVAFTDSTHNVQWVKQNEHLFSLLQSGSCLYLRSSNARHDYDWEKRRAGDRVETDSFWTHRFGRINTLWAGTKEHSLTNWVARQCIWDHFDYDHLSGKDVIDNSTQVKLIPNGRGKKHRSTSVIIA